MKKLMIVLAVGMFASNGMAQSGKKTVPPPPPPAPPTIEAPATPPSPPAAPQDVQFAPPKIVKDVPPPPPPRPPKPTVSKVRFTPPVIVNDKGYAMLIKQTNNEEPIILLTKKGITQKIRMSVWNAKPEYFENKYGKLPPPPPPTPVPPIKE